MITAAIDDNPTQTSVCRVGSGVRLFNSAKFKHKKKISDSLYQHYDEGFVGRRVVCLETGVVYDSVAKAARDLGISEAAVRMSCNRGSTKGYKYTFRDMMEES